MSTVAAVLATASFESSLSIFLRSVRRISGRSEHHMEFIEGE